MLNNTLGGPKHESNQTLIHPSRSYGHSVRWLVPNSLKSDNSLPLPNLFDWSISLWLTRKKNEERTTQLQRGSEWMCWSRGNQERTKSPRHSRRWWRLYLLVFRVSLKPYCSNIVIIQKLYFFSANDNFMNPNIGPWPKFELTETKNRVVQVLISVRFLSIL